MSLLEDVKVALRVGHDATDSEVQNLIDAALFDMANKGVSVSWLGIDPMYQSFSAGTLESGALPAMAKRAVIAYAKANYGLDNDDADRLTKAYDSIVCSLLNSRFNAAYEE